jgi:hypothetical protein
MNGNGQDQKLKCGMTQEFPEIEGSLEREKVQALTGGLSRMENVKMVSGRGSGDVIIARCN